MNQKPIIAIAPNIDKNMFGSPTSSVPLNYSDAIIKGGGAPFVMAATMDKAVIRTMLQAADGVLFVGGMDVDPRLYGEKPEVELMEAAPMLDDVQMTICREALDLGLPMLGICRGSQVINVALGGSLIQDIPTSHPESPLRHLPEPITASAGVDHEVEIEPNSVLESIFGAKVGVNSIHHQAIKEPGEGLRVTARATDGIIEGAEHENMPIYLVQWHPELMLTRNDDMLPLFRFFADTCREMRTD